MDTGRSVSRCRFCAAIAFGLTLAACGGGNGSDDRETIAVQGVVLSVLNGSEQGTRDFIVSDLSQGSMTIAVGQSDSRSQFSFELDDVNGPIFVAFPRMDNPAEPRSSGLVALDRRSIVKTLRDATDLASVAGLAAVRERDLVVADLTSERIENLELGAQQVIDIGGVDFTNAASVEAAAQRVREITDDGARPPEAP
jgi:hypothetical protein